MKRLLIALAAAVAVSTASAVITDTQLFETSFDDFVADVQGEDSSALTAYESGTQPSFTAPYPCGSYGDNFLKLDTGDATLWRTNTSAAADIYFDMAIQFTPTAAGDEPDPAGNKIVVFMDAETNIVVISGTDETDHTPVTNSVPAADYNLAAKSWARLTIAAVQDNDALRFNVLVNETPLQRSFFYSLDGDTLVREVGFSGSGAVDDFVARTTNPFLENPAVTIDGEGYDSIAEAIADNPTATPQLEDDVSYSLARGESVSVKLNNHTLDLTVPAGLYAYSTTSDGVTTYSVDYFPRTNTAGQDGSAAHPYEIADNDDLLALQAAVLADAATFASKSYIQTANIDMTGVEGFYGIGWFKSSTAYLSLPEGVTLSADGKSTTDLPFTGVYDGAGYTISNVTLVRHSYAGVFNCVAGTVTNLTVQNIGINDTTTAGEHGDLEWGCAIVGNAQGSALLENLTSAGTVWGNTPNHNTAGIVVRAQANTTIRGCVNNVALSTTSKRLGGILSFTGTSGTVRIQNCTNNAALVSTDGTRGVGGILSSPESGAASTVVISGCADFGSETAGASGYTGAIVGSLWNGATNNYTDDGGNTYPAASDICGFLNGKTVAGLAYAIDAGIDGANYLTTVKQADLAAGNTYLLLANVEASETPVYAFDAAGTIAFETNTYTFAGTVASSNPMVDVSSATADGVITYTATEAQTIATITKDGTTTPYRTLQAALAAAESGDAVNLVAAASGDVAIPAGVLVAVAQAQAVGATFTGITSLAGPGTIRLENAFPPNALCSLLMNAAWNGTLEIYNLNGSASTLYLSNYGNANSTIRVNQAWVGVAYPNFTGTLEIGALGWNVTGSFNEIVLPSTLTGTGAITVNTTPTSGTTASTLRFTGDVSGFTGNISFGSESNARVAFGGNKAGGASTIYVHQGASVTNVGTWTATDVIVTGELVANGTVSGTLKCLNGYTGTYRANSSTAAIVADSSWTGTYVVGWNPGAANTAFDINNYGTAANATIQIDGVNGEFAAFPREGTTVANVTAKIVLNANWSIGDGWTGKTNTFAYLSGSGNISVANVSGYSYARIFNIKELDGYTGTLGGINGAFIIDKVNVATAPAEGARVVATAIGTYGSINSDIPLWVGGSDSGDVLEYKADGANGEGLYVKASTPSIPVVAPSTNTVYECGSAAAATAAATAINGAKSTYIMPPENANLSGEPAAAYAALFDARAEGTSVVVELNEAGTNALETAATNVAAQIVAPANLASILSNAGTRSITVTGAQPGFYYSVVYATTLSALSTAAEGDRGLADDSGEVSLPVPAPTSGATTGFYRVLVNVEPKVTE